MSTIDRIRQATRRQSNEFHAANISTSHGRDRLRLGREMERELGLYSFNNSSADSNGSPRQQHTANDHTRDYSLDYKGGDTDTADSNDFFPRSPAPSTHDLSKHFRDFSMHAIESSIDSVELPRGGKEMGTPELDSRDFDRPAYSIRNKSLVNDRDLSAQIHSESSHGRSASLSDFGEINRRLSNADNFRKYNMKTDLAADLDRDFKSTSTPRLKQSDVPERPRSAFLDRYARPSPPFQRPRNPVAKTMEKDSPKKPSASTIPRSFKDSTQLWNDLGISGLPDRHRATETSARNQSFRLPDMTDIHSLIDTTPRLTSRKRSPLNHTPLESVPIPQNEKDIISGLRTLQDKVNCLTAENHQQKSRVCELENELRRQKALYEVERAKAADREAQLFRQSSRDSGFGSVEDSDEALERQKAYQAKDQFENQLTVLRSKITLLEGQLDAERAKTKNLQEERDEAISGMASALNESEGVKSENKALKLEIVALRKQYQTNVELPRPQGTTTAKERIKDRVATERRKDKSRAVRIRQGEGHGDHSFIQPDEIEELRKEIRELRASKAGIQNPEPKVSKTNNGSGKSLDQVTKDSHGHVQKTIRIQLENATERKDKSGGRSKHRHIKRVVVESDESSLGSSDDDVEEELTSGFSDDGNQQFINKGKKTIPIEPWLRPPGQNKSHVYSEIQNIINGSARHNSTSCTVCSRKRRLEQKKDPFSRNPLHEVHLNDSTEPLYEGVSIRPAVPPKQALNTVLSQLKDEFHHLQLQYRTLTKQYENQDPGYGKRKRKAIAEKLRDILEEFEAKADQIYALYDVVEGARQDGMGHGDWLEL